MLDENSLRLFTELDADTHVLDGQRVAILGYGALGRSAALNLRDSGVHVLVGNIADKHRDQAVEDGFAPLGIADAARQADAAFVLLPDALITGMFATEIAPRMRPGTAACFASGYPLAYDGFTAPQHVDVLMLAPRMSGHLVRERYLSGAGFVSCVSVEQDVSGQAQARLLALTHAIGSLRRGAFELPAAKEAALDLLIEQTFGVYLGLALQVAFSVGVEAGLPPEALVLELYMSGEMAATIDAFAAEGFYGSLMGHGLTALYGGFMRTSDVDVAGMEKMFQATMADINSGGFAARFGQELADGYPTVRSILDLISDDNPLSQAENRVRQAFKALAGNAVPASSPAG